MSEKRCPFCYEIVDSNVQKCPFCNEYLDVTCPYCGENVSSNAKICNHCGNELIPRIKEEHAPWAIASYVLMFFYCAICIGVCLCVFDPSATGITNSTLNDKLKNVRDLFFYFLFPFICSIIACYKKQDISKAVISMVISILFCFITVLIVLGDGL